MPSLSRPRRSVTGTRPVWARAPDPLLSTCQTVRQLLLDDEELLLLRKMMNGCSGRDESYDRQICSLVCDDTHDVTIIYRGPDVSDVTPPVPVEYFSPQLVIFEHCKVCFVTF